MPLTDKITIVTQYIVDLLSTNANKTLVGIEEVYYGDQLLIPKMPSVAVDAGPRTRELMGAPFRTENTFLIFLLVYHGKLQDDQITKKECEEVAEKLEALLHDNLTMGGNVIHGHVTSMDPGYAVRGGALLRATRMVWTGISKTRIG